MTLSTVTPDQIRAAVTSFWNAFQTKDAAALESMYAHESTVFGSISKRAEPGRLAAARRDREYFNQNSALKVRLGPVDIILLDSKSAVASYTFEFQASNISVAGRTEERIALGRATHVFAVDHDGTLRIYHEHFSLPL